MTSLSEFLIGIMLKLPCLLLRVLCLISGTANDVHCMSKASHRTPDRTNKTKASCGEQSTLSALN